LPGILSHVRSLLPALLCVAIAACHHEPSGAADGSSGDSGATNSTDAAAPIDASLPATDVGPDAGSADAMTAGADADFPLEPFASVCGAGLIDSFETQAAVDAWSCATWAEATLDPSGNPMPVAMGSTGATEGMSALSVPVRFTGSGYQQGYVGRDTSLSLAGCASIALDVTLPLEAPSGLRGGLILLMGPQASWNGQADMAALAPGSTTTVRLALAGGIEPVAARELYRDLRGVGLKIDGTDVTFSGAIALDNLRVEGLQGPRPEDLAAFSVGTFGGFVRSTGPDIPTRNGFATFSAESTVQGHALLWPKLGASGGDFVLGRAYFGAAVPSPTSSTLVFHDWSLLEARQDVPTLGTASVLMSRAFPAVRYDSQATSFLWNSADTARSPMARLAVVENGAITIHQLDSEASFSLSAMSEPWMLLWAGPAAGWGFDAPVLLTFQKRPQSATVTSQGVHFAFASAVGKVQLMPLGGLRRRAIADTTSWDAGLPDEIVEQSRAWVSILAAFPVSLTESYAIDEVAGTVTITDHCAYQLVQDDWATVPTPVAPIPPAVYLAGKNGYAVSYPLGAPVESAAATWFGPFTYRLGPTATFTLPIAPALTRQPVPLRMANDPVAAPIRAELERILDEEVPTEPMDYWLGNDEADADFLCDGWSTLRPGSPERAKAQTTGPRLAENAFLSRSVGDFAEPVTGQHYLAPTYYPEATEPFDKEWNTGRQLAALVRCSEAIDLDLARGLWPKLLATYRYHRIFFDWPTGSVLSSCMGFTELADGMHFAWDGMLGVGRLARKLGDEATWTDVAWRTARQQAALYQAWFHARWVKDIDYGVGHISDAKEPADQVETRGAIDGWVEDFGASTLEFKSFWQTTNYLYFDIPAQLSLYRDQGLEDRVRALEYEIMPVFHPSWTDGNAQDPVDGRYYGSNYTAAHLVARSLLFHDDPAALFADYQSVKGTAVASQWYTMLWHGMAGPTLLSIERARAPVAEAPIGAIRLAWSAFDPATGTVSLDFEALRDGPAIFRTRAPGGQWKEHPVALAAGQRYSMDLEP
jgi:hypothetical protein